MEISLNFLKYLIQLGEASGGQLAVDGPVRADAADCHIHVSAVHLRRTADESCALICWSHTPTHSLVLPSL